MRRLWRRFLVAVGIIKNPPRPVEHKPIEDRQVDNFCPDKYVDMYRKLWREAKVTRVSDHVMKNIRKNRERYHVAEQVTGVPWFVIACIHNLEAGQSFTKNMVNGQRLDRVTTWVPKGLGPWTSWESSCVDAFAIKKQPKFWTLENTLYFLERYNGTGYLRFHSDVNSPYLWSYTDQYTKGKYVSDGKWSNSAVSKQMGAVAVIKTLGIVL